MSYPCTYCGGQGFTGANLTVPCRPCRTTGELTDRPRRPTAIRGGSVSVTPDPWAVPGPALPPPF